MNLAPSIAPPAAPTKRARVLVVDDEVAIGRALERSLRRHHDVVAVSSGSVALSRIASGEHFDVILCDLMMPEMSGMALYARLVVAAPEHAARMIFVSGGVFAAASHLSWRARSARF